MCNCKIRPLQIAVVPNTSVTITVPPMDLDNGKIYDLVFCVPKAQEELLETVVGNEIVQLEIGAGGKKWQWLTNIGNVFYAGRLYPKREYRLAFGNDGAPAKIPHFLCLNTPCCSRFNPGNTNIN